MTFTLISGNDTVPVLMDGGDDFLMLAGASLVTTNADALSVTGNEQSITILGTLYTNGTGSNGTIEITGDLNEVYIGPDGFVGNSTSVSGNFYIAGNGNTIVNEGTISGGYGIFSLGDPSGAPNRVINNGTISGLDFVAVQLRGDILENFGLITGGVNGNSTDDTVINRSIIQGDVSLSTGNDTYNGYGGGVITGELNLAGGNDVAYIDQDGLLVLGGAGDDVLYSRDDVMAAFEFETITLTGDGNTTAFGDSFTTRMNGNSGNNQLLGSDAATIFLAGAGDDIVEGFAGNDTMRGNGGNDELSGGTDADVIFGGTGDDTIIGGRGLDILRGEQGADVFVYLEVLDSTPDTNRDIIVGFERGRDEIDVSAIGQDAFTFVGTNPFSGTGGMELGYRSVNNNTQVIVDIDENGDGIADAQIRIRGVSEVTADDFVL